MQQTFIGISNQGKIEWSDPEGLRQFLIQNPGEVFVNIGKNKRRKQRSLPENSYYWAVVLKSISDYTGYTIEEVHDAMRFKFLRTGERLERVRSTTSLSVSEFEDYLSKIRMFAGQDLNVFIPLPNEVIMQ